MPSHHVLYPADPPLECVKELIGLIARGTLQEKRDEAAKHIWTIQGYVQSLVFGDPDSGQEPVFGAGDDDKLSFIAAVVALVSMHEGSGFDPSVSPQTYGANWRFWLRKALEILINILKDLEN